MGYIMKRELIINYEHFDHIEELPLTEQELIRAAQEATHKAHAPYSEFRVGAAARLRSGEIITAANFESEVFPSGMCAERSLLYFYQSNYADEPIEALAIASDTSDGECYPCGGCRQTLLDVERRQSSPMRIIMSGGGSASVVGSAADLMPFSFKLK
jgi:cytidine deaminase